MIQPFDIEAAMLEMLFRAISDPTILIFLALCAAIIARVIYARFTES